MVAQFLDLENNFFNILLMTYHTMCKWDTRPNMNINFGIFPFWAKTLSVAYFLDLTNILSPYCLWHIKQFALFTPIQLWISNLAFSNFRSKHIWKSQFSDLKIHFFHIILMTYQSMHIKYTKTNYDYKFCHFSIMSLIFNQNILGPNFSP